MTSDFQDYRPDLCNCLALRRATRIVTQLYDREFAAVGLTATQFWLLCRLGRRGPHTINEVALVMMTDRTTVTRLLKPLERDGLVNVRPDEKDRRSRVAELTAAGGERVTAGWPAWQKANDRFEAQYGVGRAAELRSLLHAIG